MCGCYLPPLPGFEFIKQHELKEDTRSCTCTFWSKSFEEEFLRRYFMMSMQLLHFWGHQPLILCSVLILLENQSAADFLSCPMISILIISHGCQHQFPWLKFPWFKFPTKTWLMLVAERDVARVRQAAGSVSNDSSWLLRDHHELDTDRWKFPAETCCDSVKKQLGQWVKLVAERLAVNSLKAAFGDL